MRPVVSEALAAHPFSAAWLVCAGAVFKIFIFVLAIHIRCIEHQIFKVYNARNFYYPRIQSPIVNVTELIQSVLTPVALISGTGLITLTIQNRYGRVIDRLRQFSRELTEIGDRLPKRKEIVKAQMNILIKRGALLRNALFSLYLTVFLTVISSIFVLISSLATALLTLSLIFFASALFSLMVGMVVVLYEVIISYSAARNEALQTISM